MTTDLPAQRTPDDSIASFPKAQMDEILEAIRTADPGAEAWREKIRRYCSLYGRGLAAESRRRFGAETETHLAWMAEILLESAAQCFAKSSPDGASFLNGALYCLDSLDGSPLRARASSLISELRLHLDANRTEDTGMGADLAIAPALWADELRNSRPIVVLSPSPYSLFTLATLELLSRLEAPAEALILRSFNSSRVSEEWNRDGTRLFAKRVYRKLILRSNENKVSEGPADQTVLLRRLKVEEADARRMAKATGTRVQKVNDYRSGLPGCESAVAGFTGGGILSRDFIGSFAGGVINVHMGPLPKYRGMDVVEAPLLGGSSQVALTSHMMSPGLDEGPVLGRVLENAYAYRSLAELRNALAGLMPLMLIDSIAGLASGRVQPKEQVELGRQHYFVHRDLSAVIDDRFEQQGGSAAAHAPDHLDHLIKTLL